MKRPLRQEPIVRISGYLFRYWGQFLLTLSLALGSTLCAIYAPKVVRLVIDSVLLLQDMQLLLWGNLVLLVVFLSREALNSLRIRVNNVLEQQVLLDLRSKLHARLLDLPIAFYDRRKSGDIASTVIDDVTNVERALLDGTEQGISALFALTGISVLMFLENPVMASIVFIPVPILGLMSLFHARASRKIWRQVRDDSGDLNSLLMEDIQGNRLIHGFSLHDREKTRFRGKAETLRTSTLRGMFRWSLFGPSVAFISELGLLGVFAYGTYLLLHHPDTFTVGKLSMFAIYSQMVIEPIRNLAQLTQLFSTGNASGDRVFELIDHHVDIRDPAQPQPFPAGPIEARFDQVGFAYAERKEVIHNLTLRLPPARVTALVGHTGAGKSTIANLLLRYYDVTSGAVTLNGVDVRAIGLRDLRTHIGVVAQDPFLFDATVRENLHLARPGATEEEIIAALQGACAWDFVRQLPQGLDTQIGERGIRLSMGEKQRLTIARVLLKNPPIVIFDEATSSVDTITERLIQTALETLMANRTVLVIAHRLSTVHRADQIIVLEQGRIIESGTHPQLVARGGHYARLWQHQLDLIPEQPASPQESTPLSSTLRS